jgi:hypothetical protein
MKDRVAGWFSWVVPCLKFLSAVGVIVAVIYVCAVLRLGEFTLLQHVRRIWQTPEVGELRSGIATKFSRARKNAEREIRVKLASTRGSEGEASR